MDKTEQFIKMSDCPEIQEQWKIDKYDFAIKRSGYVLVSTSRIRNKAWYIWLPRQDDIQAMMEWGVVRLVEQLYHFLSRQIDYSTTDYYSNSMEQLWLIFFMHEKHSKVWSSKEEKWVKK